MAQHNRLGKKGEEIAKDFLSKKGYLILEQNWRCKSKEIDIIAQEGNTIVIIEVKTRSTELFGLPDEAVTISKQKFLIDAADTYLQTLNFEAEVRFDIISIIFEKGNPAITHIKEAFVPQLD